MATSGVANQFQQRDLQFPDGITRYIMSSGKSVPGAGVQSTKLEIMSLLTSYTHWRDHDLYITLGDANTNPADAEISMCHVPWGFNIILQISCIVSDLLKIDLLHTMQIRMLENLQKWVFQLMRTHARRDKYNAIWLSVPAYHEFTPKNESYEEVSQWNGKEMKGMSWDLHGIVSQSMRGGSATQSPIFNHGIEFTCALSEFDMYAHYKSPDDATLSYMEEALHCFHTFKDVFSSGQAGKKVKSMANALRMELVRMRKVDEETNAKTWMPSSKRREMIS